MIKELTIPWIATLLLAVSGNAISQEKGSSPTIRSVGSDAIAINSTVPITDKELARLGVRNLKGADVARMAATLGLLGAARTGGSGSGLNYTCTSESNACVCNGWLDCVLVMDECKTPPKDSDGKLCTGAGACTCDWH